MGSSIESGQGDGSDGNLGQGDVWNRHLVE